MDRALFPPFTCVSTWSRPKIAASAISGKKKCALTKDACSSYAKITDWRCCKHDERNSFSRDYRKNCEVGEGNLRRGLRLWQSEFPAWEDGELILVLLLS